MLLINKQQLNKMATSKKVNETKTATKNVTLTVAPVATKKATPVKQEMVKLGNSTYHFVRNWLKPLFKSSNIEIKWLKDADAYTGVIKIHKADIARAKKVYNDYVKKEQCVEMITF